MHIKKSRLFAVIFLHFCFIVIVLAAFYALVPPHCLLHSTIEAGGLLDPVKAF